MNISIEVVNGQYYDDSSKQAFISSICGSCAQNCARGCHCLENRIMPCSFYAPTAIYARDNKSGVIYKIGKEKVIADKGAWRVIPIRTHPVVEHLELKGVEY